ncbi:S8 family serine peptidase [Leptobacterium flavescens]|uniref:S8 family serine peptidase n=1 Tax=Leptobacterium flavescens TaxID=472055 RepID=A0A6P0UMJ3_9FLAO|nr:S8 family peptidase [Leptobacterium flavescens]NER14237.1 S8 family serine peptidase [Leptobacterium flavescens]
MRFIKPIAFGASLILASCGSTAILSTPIENIDTVPTKVTDLNESQLKSWNQLDLVKDTIPGMSVDRAYSEVIRDRKGKKVIVGIIDSGVDIDHEDLKNVIWTNKGEKPGNGIDDDKNGYVDDIHGWNFLGDAIHENLEYVRILKKGDNGSAVYKEAKAAYDEEIASINQQKPQIDQLLQFIPLAQKAIKDHLGKEEYTIEEVKAINSTDQQVAQSKGLLLFLDENDLDYDSLKEYSESLEDQVKYNLNVDYDGRSVVGDNPDDLNDRDYGNNQVYGPDKEKASHGTHVAGIVAAQRNNGIGMNGVAKNVEIMVIRAVPDGDEYDKDIALAIRYAADNGAKVINTSFGKDHSPHAEWVWDAIKYAASKDVLIVNAAGNDASNIDENESFPSDSKDGNNEIADNFITVGALNYKYGGELVANFSNYGKKQVDVFAPGVKIWSTMPNNEYDYSQGTSMAAPAVSGVAALIRSYYPKLSAAQVKRILMSSGLPVKTNVIIGGDNSNTASFNNLSKSGKIVNAYNALILAGKVAKGEVNLL